MGELPANVRTITQPVTSTGNDAADWREDQDAVRQFKDDVDQAVRSIDSSALSATDIDIRLSDSPMVNALMQNPTEDNVAIAFAERYRGKYVYLHGRGKWFRWVETHWSEDVTGNVLHKIRELARAYNTQGSSLAAKASFVSGVAKLCSHDPVFSREMAQFDADNYLLNCPDGTYDLRARVKRKHNPNDCITHCTPVSPCMEGSALFQRFIDDITDGDELLSAFLQRSLGACLSGATEEHWIMFWNGSGRNGKNTLGDLVVWIMGDYAGVIPSSTLMTQHNPVHKTEIMSLKGKRLVVAGEIEEGSFWAESKLKELTGDEYLVGNYMRQDHVQFRRTHKHLIYGNHRPQLRNADTAMKSRMKIVPFVVSFEGREDMDLPTKLRDEGGHVLHWLLEGHRAWMDNGKKIGSCPAIDSESDDYFSSQSTIDLWISECCDVEANPEGAASKYVKSGVAYNSYSEWKKDRGESPISATRFGEQITKRYEKKRSDGWRYVGLRLKL